MRRGRDNGWMEDDNKQMVAINLGSDFTAEHEWGIKDLYRTLGVTNDQTVMGIERYRVSKPNMDQIVLIEENKNNAALICLKYQCDMKYLAGKKLDKISNGELSMYGDDELATAWDGGSFGIRVKRPVNIKRIKRIYDAIKNEDAAIWLGGGGVFQNAGLVIGIISAIPKHLLEQMHEAHVDRKKLEDAADATGIKQKIDALNEAHCEKYKDLHSRWDQPCGYYALSPAWAMKNCLRRSEESGELVSTDIKTVYPVIFWLNPREQQKNESGWYTVEELEQWMEGKGPVIERAKATAERRAKEKQSV